MLKVGMLSKWHVHAKDYAAAVAKREDAQIAAVWDDDEVRGSEWAKELGCPYFSDLSEMLAAVDAVICDAPTGQHYNVIKQAALAGVHVFTEKALAPTVKECEELADIIEKSGITFTISLPARLSPSVQFVKKLMDEGFFGQVSLVRMRNGHDGVSGKWLPAYWFVEEDAGGGALMDLGCHPMYTASYLFKDPKRISSIMTAPFGTNVDEAASATVEYKNGAVFTGETSFISYSSPGIFEVYGSEATFIMMGGDMKLYGRNIEKYVGRDGLTPKLPRNDKSPLGMFLDACINGTGTPEMFSAREGVELTRLLENSYISNRENRIVEL